MKKIVILYTSLSLAILCFCPLSLAGEEKRLNLTLRNGRVSADIHNAPLGEVADEIRKTWSILVEFYGGVDKDRLVSVKFENLSLLDSLHRLFRGFNFFHIEGEKLGLLVFGDSSLKKDASHTSIITVSSAQGANQGKGSTSASGSRSPKGGTDQAASGSRVSWVREERDGDNRTNLVGEKWEVPGGRMGTSGTSDEIQNLGEVNRGRDSRNIYPTSFTTPIILDTNGQAISALSNDIFYDPNLLTNPRVTIGESAKQAGKEVILNEIRPGLLRVGIVGLNQEVISDGVAAHVTFDVLIEGQISVRNQPTGSDPNGNRISMTFKDGRISTGR